MQNLTNADQGDYSCKVKNQVGSVTSDQASLTVKNNPPSAEFTSIVKKVEVGGEGTGVLSYSDPEDKTLYFSFTHDPEIDIAPGNGTL